MINDGSTDKTEEIIFQMKDILDQKLWKFCYIYQKNRRSRSSNQCCIKKGYRGVLTSLDIDDLMMPNSISERVKWLKRNPSYALVRTNGYFLFPDKVKKLFYPEDYQASPDIFQDILNGKIYNWAGTYMIRTEKWLERCPSREIYH